MHIVEHGAGALVEHVRIEAARAQQRDAPFPLGPLGLQPRNLFRQLLHLQREVLLRAQTVVAAVGVHAEVADQQPRRHIECERGQDGLESRAGDHARQHRSGALTAY